MKADPVSQCARFGLGAGPDGLPDDDLRPALLAELDAGDQRPPSPLLATAASGLAAIKAAREGRRLNGGKPVPEFREAVAAIASLDRADTLGRGLAAPHGFRERLVAFWTNHFTVSVRQGGCRPLAGSFRREAIAPHVTSRFADMLLAVMRHPAMLRYLENDRSVGPDSRVGQRARRGLNENLARECLELHTLSPASGYTQADVTAFAAVLTGWSTQDHDEPYGFVFRPAAHEPGDKTMLGVSFPEGEQGGRIALDFLAAHPSTHRHLAMKLVRHFGTDTPDPADVRLIEATLRDTGGDLGAASRALLALRSARRPHTKLRSPQNLVLASFRALAPPASPHPDAAGMLASLGQPLFAAPLPNGWPDAEADWLGPQSMVRRVDLAWALGGHANLAIDPARLARLTLGDMLRPETAFAVGHAGSRREAVALLLASPDFQRR